MTVEAGIGLTAEEAAARVLARSRRYVEIETPSRYAAGIRELAALVAADLEDIGADVELMDVPDFGANLRARLPGTEPELPPVVVLAHIDTVHPLGTLAERPLRIEGDRAYGPGIYDMKTGLALAVEALAVIHDRGARPRRPVELLVTCDEEIGSHSARPLIEEAAGRAAAVLVPEPCMPDSGVKTARKGVDTYRIEAHGRAAHAGIVGAAAVSAIGELIHALQAALDLAEPDRGTTVNVGTIAGGTASNVVAASAHALVDVRLAEPGEGERIHEALTGLAARHPEARVVATRIEDRPPLVRTPPVVALYEHTRRLAAELGVDLPEGASGGGSDGSIAAAAGAPTLDGLGAQGGGAHAVDEHIVLSDLPFRLALFVRLFETL